MNGPKETPRRSKRSVRSFESPAVGRTPHELKKKFVDNIETHDEMEIDTPNVEPQANDLEMPNNDKDNVSLSVCLSLSLSLNQYFIGEV